MLSDITDLPAPGRSGIRYQYLIMIDLGMWVPKIYAARWYSWIVSLARPVPPGAGVELVSRSCGTDVARVPVSSGSMSGFRACRTARGWAGCLVAPGIRARRVPRPGRMPSCR